MMLPPCHFLYLEILHIYANGFVTISYLAFIQRLCPPSSPLHPSRTPFFFFRPVFTGLSSRTGHGEEKRGHLRWRVIQLWSGINHATLLFFLKPNCRSTLKSLAHRRCVLIRHRNGASKISLIYTMTHCGIPNSNFIGVQITV